MKKIKASSIYHQKKKSRGMASEQGRLVRKVLQAAVLTNKPPLFMEMRESSKRSTFAVNFRGNLMSKNSH